MVLNQLKRQIHQDRYETNEIATSKDYLYNNSTEQELDVRFLESILQEYILELPEKRRQVFLLSRKYYMTNKQIAEHLGISVNTVESQMTKALATLRNKLDKVNHLYMLPISNLILLELLKKM
ncbi:RNA polymerase sigma factor [compost metagenome]